MKVQSAPDQILFDPATVDNTAAWQVVNDDVMGGVSTSNFWLTNGLAVFGGEVSLKNNGGFASVRTRPARHDLSGSDSFVLRVRGDGRRYKFTVRTGRSLDRTMYQATFETKKGEWSELCLPFNDFVPTFRGRVLSSEPRLDPAAVTSLGFLISDKQSGNFQLEIAWIKAVKCSSS